MMEIINDARGNLRRRLTELRDKIRVGQAHFLGTDLEEFKASFIERSSKAARTMSRCRSSMTVSDMLSPKRW